MMPGYGWNNYGGFGGIGGFGLIGLILNFVILIGIIVGMVLLAVWAIRRFTNNPRGSMSFSSPSHGMATAREILQARYARGEITREEYQQMLTDIS
jgi:putative membrane protein